MFTAVSAHLLVTHGYLQWQVNLEETDEGIFLIVQLLLFISKNNLDLSEDGILENKLA